MPFAPHIRATAIGRIGTSSEKFAYGVCIAPAGGFNLTTFINAQPNRDALNSMASHFVTLHSTAGTLLSSRAVLEVVKFAPIGADGKYTDDPVIVNVADTPGAGSPGDPYVTPQTAQAVSLVTARRGATGRGRFFLPMPVRQLQADCRMTEADVEPTRAAAQAFLNGINDQPGFDVLNLRVVVASSKGYNSPVTGVRVGRVLDTIRSRRTSLPEEYSPTVPVE